MSELSDKVSDYSKYGLYLIDKTASSALKIGSSTFIEFGKFLGQKDVLDLAVAVTIGTYLTTFSREVITIIGNPIIDKLIGKSKFGERYKYKLFGMEFDIGRLLELILNLLLTLFIMFMIFKYIPKMVSINITK
jgi:large-conductance mechanosensitive channel